MRTTSRVLLHSLILQLRLQVLGESADFEQLAHRVWEFGKEIRGILVVDYAVSQIDPDLITFSNDIIESGALDNRQAGVDRIPVKRAGERRRNNSLDAQTHDGRYGLFSGAAAAEVSAGDQDVEPPQFRRETVAEHFESMFGESVGFDVDEISTGNNYVGVDVIREFINLPLKFFLHAQISLGSEMTPLIADAASVAGLHR